MERIVSVIKDIDGNDIVLINLNFLRDFSLNENAE